jgi:hypothetical protein
MYIRLPQRHRRNAYHNHHQNIISNSHFSSSSSNTSSLDLPRAIMASLLLLLLAGTLHKVSAGAIPTTYTPSNANCNNYDIPVSVSTTGIDWIAPKWTNDTGLIDFVSLTSSRTTANFSSPVGGSVNLTGQYTISATFCSPKTQTNKSANVLLATHGLGYDRR